MKKKLRELLDKFDNDFGFTFPDFAFAVLEMAEEAANEELVEAIARYHQEEFYDRTQLGMRGDMESVEMELLDLIRSMADQSDTTSESTLVEEDWDFSLLNDAIANKRPYPAVLIEKVQGAKRHELPVLLKAGYVLKGDNYVFHREAPDHQ